MLWRQTPTEFSSSRCRSSPVRTYPSNAGIEEAVTPLGSCWPLRCQGPARSPPPRRASCTCRISSELLLLVSEEVGDCALASLVAIAMIDRAARYRLARDRI